MSLAMTPPESEVSQEVLRMRNVSRLLLLLGVFAFGSYMFAAQAPKAGQQEKGQAEKAVQGTLVKVDAEAKTLTVKDAQNKEMVFHYTDKTEIVGSENTIQGLAAKAGSQLNITYTAAGGNNIATRIEMGR
jgi:hypothetical protein